MPETTDPSTPAADPTGWCHWHQGPSGTARMVRIIEQESGPGYQQYACAPCRDQHRLTPIGGDPSTAAWRMYIAHLHTCKACTLDGRCDIGQPLWDDYQAVLPTTAAAR